MVAVDEDFIHAYLTPASQCDTPVCGESLPFHIGMVRHDFSDFWDGAFTLRRFGKDISARTRATVPSGRIATPRHRGAHVHFLLAGIHVL